MLQQKTIDQVGMGGYKQQHSFLMLLEAGEVPDQGAGRFSVW